MLNHFEIKIEITYQYKSKQSIWLRKSIKYGQVQEH